jgi:hypothetical protein
MFDCHGSQKEADGRRRRGFACSIYRQEGKVNIVVQSMFPLMGGWMPEGEGASDKKYPPILRKIIYWISGDVALLAVLTSLLNGWQRFNESASPLWVQIAGLLGHVWSRAPPEADVKPWPSKEEKASNPDISVTKETYTNKYGVISPEQCFYSDEGYVFLEGSVKIDSQPRGAASVRSCGVVPNKADPTKNYTLDGIGKRICVQQVNGMPEAGDHYCSLTITATEARLK